jgi:predicted small integral membrane protein
MRLKPILIGAVLVAVFFVVALKVMDYVAPRGTGSAPVLVALPPLPPSPARSSSIIAPVAIALTAIRDAADRGAPRSFNGTADNPVQQLLQDADIKWTAARGPIAATGAQDTLTMSAPLTGALDVTGAISTNVRDALGGALGNLLGGNVAKQLGNINIKNVNANAEIRGNVVVSAQPRLTPNWRIDPNLAAQVTLGDTNVAVAGARINVPAQVKPMIDNAVNEQIIALQQRLRNDPAFEQNARREWAKLCRSIPLQGASALQNLFIELKPTRAVAAQPRIDASNLTLTLGVEAETRVTSTQTQPNCPFPATLTIVPPGPGKLSIGVPVDMPFTELNKIIEAQLAGKTFPEDNSGAVAVTVKKATVSASGDRLLISLLVNAKEKQSWFGLGGEATVHVWGKPALDQAAQTLRFTDLELAVESEAAFGLLGAAARAAMPLLQKTLAERATIDLKPFASNAQKKIAAVMADFQKNENGIRVGAEISSLRLGGIAFDSKTLRVIAEADGAINVNVTALPGL